MIPRGQLDIEPDVELSEEEQRAKEKRMIEIKKMIAIQNLQQLGLEDQQQQQNNYSLSGNGNYANYTNNNSINFSNDLTYEKEKKAHEHVSFYLFINILIPFYEYFNYI